MLNHRTELYNGRYTAITELILYLPKFRITLHYMISFSCLLGLTSGIIYPEFFDKIYY